MAKKGLGKFVAFAAIAGVVAAGISYFTKYKSFHDELEEDFHDFEGEDEKDSEEPADSTMTRNYVSLNPEKEPEAVKEEPEAAETPAEPAETSEESEIKEEEAGETAETEAEPVKEQEPVSEATTIEDDITE